MATQTFSITFDGYWREKNISGVPAHSGIYCVYTCTNDPDTKRLRINKLLYIGEAVDVKERLTKHNNWDLWRKYLLAGQELCVSTAPVESSSRVRVEAACINKHKPPTNTEYTEAFPFDTTQVVTSGTNLFLHGSFTVYRS